MGDQHHPSRYGLASFPSRVTAWSAEKGKTTEARLADVDKAHDKSQEMNQFQEVPTTGN